MLTSSDAHPMFGAHPRRGALNEAGVDGVPAVRQAREQAHPCFLFGIPDRRATLALASHEHLERREVDDPLHAVATAGGGVLVDNALSLLGLDGDRVPPAVAQHGQDVWLGLVHGNALLHTRASQQQFRDMRGKNILGERGSFR